MVVTAARMMVPVVVTGVTVACVLTCSIAVMYGMMAARRRRWMARHPAPTFVFADLVGYTAFTDRCGDEAAARLAREFGRAMLTLGREYGARWGKSVGDGAMIWAPHAAQAVALVARALNEVGTRSDLLPVRVGVHTGPAVTHLGDWYGSTVNVAARLASEASPNEALISGATQLAARSGVRLPLEACGELRLRGVTHPVSVWRLAPDEPDVYRVSRRRRSRETAPARAT